MARKTAERTSQLSVAGRSSRVNDASDWARRRSMHSRSELESAASAAANDLASRGLAVSPVVSGAGGGAARWETASTSTSARPDGLEEGGMGRRDGVENMGDRIAGMPSALGSSRSEADLSGGLRAPPSSEAGCGGGLGVG